VRHSKPEQIIKKTQIHVIYLKSTMASVRNRQWSSRYSTKAIIFNLELPIVQLLFEGSVWSTVVGSYEDGGRGSQVIIKM